MIICHDMKFRGGWHKFHFHYQLEEHSLQVEALREEKAQLQTQLEDACGRLSNMEEHSLQVEALQEEKAQLQTQLEDACGTHI